MLAIIEKLCQKTGNLPKPVNKVVGRIVYHPLQSRIQGKCKVINPATQQPCNKRPRTYCVQCQVYLCEGLCAVIYHNQFHEIQQN